MSAGKGKAAEERVKPSPHLHCLRYCATPPSRQQNKKTAAARPTAAGIKGPERREDATSFGAFPSPEPGTISPPKPRHSLAFLPCSPSSKNTDIQKICDGYLRCEVYAQSPQVRWCLPTLGQSYRSGPKYQFLGQHTQDSFLNFVQLLWLTFSQRVSSSHIHPACPLLFQPDQRKSEVQP